jgi:haloalkane dehalogenase
MDVSRTPDDRFADLPDYPFAPHYAEVDGLRMHYVDEGPADADPVLLLHGEPSWSFLYRKVIPVLTAAGHRCVAPDLIGFGRSDKPTSPDDYTYQRHVDWTRGVLEQLDLRGITLVCQDWGGLIGLRLAAEHGERFARIVAANTGLPTGDQDMPKVWWAFHDAVAKAERLDVARFVRSGCVTELSPEVLAAYDAPFPDEPSKAGAKKFPSLVPTSPDDPASEANRAAWERLTRWDKPFLCAFGDSDPITGAMAPILQRVIPGAQGQPHTTIERAGHFLQEDAGERLGEVVRDWLATTS